MGSYTSIFLHPVKISQLQLQIQQNVPNEPKPKDGRDSEHKVSESKRKNMEDFVDEIKFGTWYHQDCLKVVGDEFFRCQSTAFQKDSETFPPQLSEGQHLILKRLEETPKNTTSETRDFREDAILYRFLSLIPLTRFSVFLTPETPYSRAIYQNLGALPMLGIKNISIYWRITSREKLIKEMFITYENPVKSYVDCEVWQRNHEKGKQEKTRTRKQERKNKKNTKRI